MPLTLTRRLALIAALAAVPALALAQHAAPSPYAGEERRAIKALSEKEVRDLLDGAGMGLAKAAELNRYPGPMHVLEHARELGLTPAQREALAELMRRHKAEARELGAEVVARERELDALFAGGRADPASVDALTGRLAAAQARLRASHLKTHVATRELLSAEQVDRYVKVRGYDGAGAQGHGHGAHGGAHRH